MDYALHDWQSSSHRGNQPARYPSPHLFRGGGIPRSFVEGAIALYPQLRPALEPHKPKLLLESPLLSPTQLGALMDPILSARAVNKLLCDRGLQKATGEKNPAYELIGSGHEFGKVVADTAKGHGKTIQHVRWYESVMSLLN